MGRRRLVTIILALVVVAVLAQIAFAALGAGPAGMAHRRGMWMQRIAQELNLTPDQRARTKPILQDARQQAKAVREDKSLTPEARCAKLSEIRVAAMSRIREILTPDQLAKLQEMRKRHVAKRMERMAQALNLTPDQRASIKPILEDAHRQMKLVREDKSLSAVDRQARLKEIRDSIQARIRPILTPEQWAKFEQIRSNRCGGAR